MLNKYYIKRKAGFTIIEVVLVLAIAGLIFLMIFVAVPSLQRSQRDTQRKQDVSVVATALTQYQTNNLGDLPSKGNWKTNSTGTNLANSFGRSYLGDLKNQDGESYTIYGHKLTSSGLTTDGGKPVGFSKLTTSNRINIYSNASCGSDGIPVVSSGARNYAVVLRLEGGGYYCVDNK